MIDIIFFIVAGIFIIVFSKKWGTQLYIRNNEIRKKLNLKEFSNKSEKFCQRIVFIFGLLFIIISVAEAMLRIFRK